MSNFSKRERRFAKILSSSPRLKGIIKTWYIYVSYFLNRKGKKLNIRLNLIKDVNEIEPIRNDHETFFGYYDKSPENRSGWILFNETRLSTTKRPSSNIPIEVYAINASSKTIVPLGISYSYNWQQGCRAQWLTDKEAIYNVFENGAYRSVVFDIANRRRTATFNRPVQDCYRNIYFLTLNYERIMKLRPDYGYRNLPLLNDDDVKDVTDGIWKIDISTGEESKIISLQDLLMLEPKTEFNNSFHKVNHIMISPDGKSFIFIHRWYEHGRRHDRLIWSDFSSLKVLADNDMVSHMCWIDPATVFGYLRYNGHDGFYFIDITNNQVRECTTLNNFISGDGHPSYSDGWIVIDSYPDKSRMQQIYLYNINRDKVHCILELFNGVKYQGEQRCDLHPRFSMVGKRIYFDTVFNGSRRLSFIDINLDAFLS